MMIRHEKAVSVCALLAMASFSSSTLPDVRKETPTTPMTSREVPDRYLVINLEKQTAHYFLFNPNSETFEHIKQTRITSGRPHRDGGSWTPTGTFYTGTEGSIRYSSSYGNAPMPNYVHLYKGIYMHAGVISPSRSRLSHGCIRLSREDSRFTRDFCHPGTAVHVKNRYQVPIARKRKLSNMRAL